MRKFKISLNRVHDTVSIKEGNEKLVLKVDADPLRMVAGLSQAQKLMQSLKTDSTEEETENAAKYFAQVIFGDKQAGELMEFYRNDAGCVINVCGQYFAQRLSKLISKAQKKIKT